MGNSGNEFIILKAPKLGIDESVLDMVLAKKELVVNAEERRLFYVALTRAKKHVYLVASKEYPSTFASEVSSGDYEITVEGYGEAGVSCPVCKTGHIVSRQGKLGDFYSCSNYPYCTYKPRICPQCQDGYLVLRRGRYSKFLGCSNYPSCIYTRLISKWRTMRAQKE